MVILPPHRPSVDLSWRFWSRPIKALKLTGLAGAYWRGDEHNKQLTRIYGTAFYSKEDLDAYALDLQLVYDRDWFMVAETKEGETVAVAISGRMRPV